MQSQLPRAMGPHPASYVDRPSRAVEVASALVALALHIAVAAALLMPAVAPRPAVVATAAPASMQWITVSLAEYHEPPMAVPEREAHSAMRHVTDRRRSMPTWHEARPDQRAATPVDPAAPLEAEQGAPATADPPVLPASWTEPSKHATADAGTQATSLSRQNAAAVWEAPANATPHQPWPMPGQALPAYPEAAREDGLEGVVVLLIYIDAAGRVIDVRWVSRSGVPLLDHAARDAVRGWRFHAASDGHGPVSGHVKVALRFSLRDPRPISLAMER
jgi:periplasmic protein TonB